MKTITKEQYEYLVRNGCCFEGYVEGLGVASSKRVVTHSDRPEFPNDRAPGVQRDTTFASIQRIPTITPLIPVASPAINHEQLNTILRETLEPGFTQTTKVWVRKLEAEIATKKATNELNINIMEAEIIALTAQGNHPDIATKRGEIQKLRDENTELENIEREIKVLAVSNQVYEVIVDTKYNTPTETRAGAVFNEVTDRFELILPSNDDIHFFVHELKHAYQFETGAFSSGRRRDGSPFYDKSDEWEAYRRGALFGGEHITSLPSLYDQFQNDPKDATQLPSIVLNTPSALQRIANTTHSAFRINGVTYKDQSSK